MGGIIFTWLAIVLIILGALVQTFRIAPFFFDRLFDNVASTLTIVLILFGVSILLILLWLKSLKSYREGFQTKTAMDSWKQLVDMYQIRQLCELKTRIADKAFLSFKGAPPDQLSDIQARERTEKLFSEKTTQGSINCALFKKSIEANDIDSFFLAIQEIPSAFLIQSYETAEQIRNLLKKQVNDLQGSLAVMKKEGFVDSSVGICSPEVVEERRKFLRQKKLDDTAQSCLLPEEVPFESKDKIAESTVTKISNTYLKYMRLQPGKPTMDSLLKESLSLEAELNKIQEKAQSGTLLSTV